MLAVFKKELYRVFSDKKLIFTTFFLTPLIIIFIYGLIIWLATTGVMSVQEHVPMAVVINAPKDLPELDGFEVTYQESEQSVLESFKDDLKDEKLELVVYFPKDFTEKVATYQTETQPVVDILYNAAKEFSESAFNKFNKNILDVYEHQIIAERVGNESYLTAFTTKDLSTEYGVVSESQLAGKLFGKILPPIMIIFLAAAAMSLVLESVPGEKERGTLATQLLTPIKRSHLALGKFFGLTFLTFLSSLTMVIAIGILGVLVYHILPADTMEGMSFSMSFSITQIFQLLIIITIAVSIIVSWMMTASAFGKNLKEAPGYVTPIYMMIMIMSFLPMYIPTMKGIWRYFVPMLGQVVAMVDIFSTEMTWMNFGITVGSGVLYIFIAIFIIRSIFYNERMIVSN